MASQTASCMGGASRSSCRWSSRRLTAQETQALREIIHHLDQRRPFHIIHGIPGLSSLRLLIKLRRRTLILLLELAEIGL